MKTLRALALSLVLCAAAAVSARAQNAALLPLLKPQFTDSNGLPLVGGFLYSYQAGTSTPLATYTDATGSTPNANPLTLDSAGRGSVWLGASNYKIVVTDSLGVTQFTVDNVSSISLAQLQGNGTLTTLSVSGNATIGGNLTVSGALTIASLTVTGAESVGGTLTAQNLSVTGNGTVGGALGVTGLLTASGGVSGNVTGALTGNASTATALAATPTSCSAGYYATGIAANGNANCTAVAAATPIQAASGSSCTTGTSANATCTIAVNWGVAYSGTSYQASCSLTGPFTGYPNIVGITKATGSVTVTIENGQGSAAVASSATGIDCIGYGH